MDLPVVSTDCRSGPSEILDGGRFGRLVPVGDAAAMADAITASLNDTIDPAPLLERAAEFRPAAVADRYLKLLLDDEGS